MNSAVFPSEAALIDCIEISYCPELLGSDFVGNSQTFTTFGAAASQHFAAIGGCHAFAETVFVNSLAV